ncbi:MAG: 6-phosphogluconolactonase [Acidimicrobiales bacterium]
MHHQTRTFAGVDDLASAAADFVAEHARRCVAAQGAFSFAVSGGRTPRGMFAELLGRDVPWEQTVIYQVDERVAPPGDPGRNLTYLVETLADVSPTIEPMPVNDDDLDTAADRYADRLPRRLDLVHLGLGSDGHTASLVPGDPVLDVRNRLVSTTGEYQGRRRMTLTYHALARADQLLWLVAGSEKHDALSLLLSGDVSIPAGRVRATRSLIMADRSAM